jgi:hypothetical protein
MPVFAMLTPLSDTTDRRSQSSRLVYTSFRTRARSRTLTPRSTTRSRSISIRTRLINRSRARRDCASTASTGSAVRCISRHSFCHIPHFLISLRCVHRPRRFAIPKQSESALIRADDQFTNERGSPPPTQTSSSSTLAPARLPAQSRTVCL